jgi:LysR family hydrogen peroxide-inducible transcriptional activator
MHFGAHAVTLRQLQYCLAVSEARSFRLAADRCHVSQPSLSAQIAELEAALGIRLFERDRRAVLPTPAGEVVAERARRVLLEVEDLLGAARTLVDPLSGTLRVGVIPTIAPYLLPRVDPSLRAAFERLTLVWCEDKTAALLAALWRGELEAALVALEADLGDVVHETLGLDPFVLAVPRGHRLARSKRPVRVGELQGEPVLLLEDGHCFRDQTLALCARAGTRELGFRATSLTTLSQMVAGGEGITLLPKLAVDVECRGKDLVVRAFTRPAPKRTIVLAWRPGSALAASLQSVARVARKAFA